MLTGIIQSKEQPKCLQKLDTPGTHAPIMH